MLKLIVAFVFMLFIMTVLEAIAEIAACHRDKKEIFPRVWWIPAIIGGIWMFLFIWIIT